MTVKEYIEVKHDKNGWLHIKIPEATQGEEENILSLDPDMIELLLLMFETVDRINKNGTSGL